MYGGYHSAVPGSAAGPSTASDASDSFQESAISVAGPSGYADSDANMANYAASMTSSVRAHVYEGGMRYHAFRDGKYAFPNDEVEQNRDDMKHAMALLLMRNKHFYAPVGDALKRGGEVLDLGRSPFVPLCSEDTDGYALRHMDARCLPAALAPRSSTRMHPTNSSRA